MTDTISLTGIDLLILLVAAVVGWILVAVTVKFAVDVRRSLHDRMDDAVESLNNIVYYLGGNYNNVPGSKEKETYCLTSAYAAISILGGTVTAPPVANPKPSPPGTYNIVFVGEHDGKQGGT